MLMVGDSWGQLMCAFGTFNKTLEESGYKDRRASCLATTKAGTWAKDWAKPGELDTAKNFLRNNPQVKAVFLSLGGNDLLNKWRVGMDERELAKVYSSIRADIAAVVEELLSTREDVEIVMAGYDYPNFDLLLPGDALEAYRELYENMGNPTPPELNSSIVGLNQMMQELALKTNRLHFVPTLGLNQHIYGHEEYGIEPGELPAPGEDLLIGGDPELTQPRRSLLNIKNTPLVDPYHLNPSGFKNYSKLIMRAKLGELLN